MKRLVIVILFLLPILFRVDSFAQATQYFTVTDDGGGGAFLDDVEEGGDWDTEYCVGHLCFPWVCTSTPLPPVFTLKGVTVTGTVSGNIGTAIQHLATLPASGQEFTGTITNTVVQSGGGPCPSGTLVFTRSVFLSLKTTYGKNTLGSQVVGNLRFCGMTPACSNGVTPKCGSPSFTTIEGPPATTQCPQFIRASFLLIRFSRTDPGECLGLMFPTSGPGPCDP